MNADGTLRVVQLTDIHFGAAPAPIDGREAAITLRHVLDHVRAHEGVPDLFVATGDLVDDATDASALGLRSLLVALDAPVYCLAGNHDGESTLATLRSETVHAVASSRHGAWLFCYVDSNGRGRVRLDDGTVRDHPERAHRGGTGEVDAADLQALDELLATTDAAHAMVWVHHPPVPPAMFDDPANRSTYFHALHQVLARHANVRGVASGHLHTGFVAHEDGITYYGTPTTWLAMDFERRVLTPPGYRSFGFLPDGAIETSARLVDLPVYAVHSPLPAWVDRVLSEHLGLTPTVRERT